MPWNLDSSRPIYLQIIERVQMDIITGRYQPGDKLPSVRDLAQEAAVNPNTMQKALSELERSASETPPRSIISTFPWIPGKLSDCWGPTEAERRRS